MAYAVHSNETLFFAGSINRPGRWFHPSGEGLTLCALDEQTGDIRRLKTYPEAENAIWLTQISGGLIVATERYLNEGIISSFSINENDVLSRIGDLQSSHGGAVCHITVTPDSKTAFVCSFLGGLTVHNISDSGKVSPAYQIIRYEGRGPKPMQETSHPHQTIVSPDGRHLFVCDLGSDMIWIHAIYQKAQKTQLSPGVGINAYPGSGPRHLVFHPVLPLFYLLGQLDARVQVYTYQATNLSLLTTYNSLPSDFSGEPVAAAIKFHPSGKTLYISDRGSNSITVFTLEKNGNLTKTTCFSTQGKSPRDFAISPSGRWLIVLNQDSDILVSFQIDPQTGLPVDKPVSTLTLGCPVCILFYKTKHL